MKEYLRTMLDHDSFARHCGFVVNSAGAGTAAVTVVLGPQHMNGMNSAHGGLIFSLADFAFAAACNSHQMMAVGIDVHIAYFNGANVGDTLIATAEEIHARNRLATYCITVNKGDGTLVAKFDGLAYRKKERHPD